MGNKASVAVNHGKSIQYTKKSIRSNNKRKNNKSNPLKCEFEYNHNLINETMVEAGALTHDVNDLRYWVPTQLTPSKILLLTSSLCPCPEAPPPSHTDVKTNSSIMSTSPGDENHPSQEEGSRAIHNNNNYDRFMTPFSFKRSQVRDRDRGSTYHHHHQQETAENGESHQISQSMGLSNQQRQNLASGSGSGSGYTTATTVLSQDLPISKLLEGGDPHLPDPDPIRSKIKNMQKSNKKYKPAWMPEVKESSAETNLSKMMMTRSSKSIFTDSKSSYTNISLKTKSTKLSFGAKLKNSILRNRFKKFRSSSMTTNAPKRNNTNPSSETANTTVTTTTHGSRVFSDDAKTKNLRSLVDIKSPESLQKDIITSDTVIIHKLAKSIESAGSMYRRKSNFSTVGGSDEVQPSAITTPNAGKSSAAGDNETQPKQRDGGDRGSSSSRGSSPTRKGGPSSKSKGKQFQYLRSKHARPAVALNPIPIRKGQRAGKKKPPPPPVFIGNYGCGGGCSSSVRKSQNPADRLKNVDIVEELVYNCADGGGCGCGVDCCSCNPDCDYYSCCNDCGECQPVSQPCSCGNNGSQGNPVKYCRRQRFNFGDERNGDNCSDGPPFTWQGARPCNPYDEVPVGKNPTCNDASMDGSNDCNALPSESGTYFFDAERRCFAKVIEVKNPDVPEPEIMDEIIDEEPILTNIEPIIQPVIRPTNQMCGGGGQGAGMAPMPFVGTLGQQQGQNPMGHLSPPSAGKSNSKSGKKDKLKSGGGSNTNNNQGTTDGYGNDYGGNLGLMGLSGMNMPGLTAMGPYGTIAMPQYQYNAPPPIRPVPPNNPVGPGAPYPAHAPYPPAPPGQPACCGPTCFPGYPSTNYPPYNPYFTGPGGDYGGRRGKKDKNKKSKKDKKKKKGKNNSSQVHGSKSVQTNYSYDDEDE